MIDHLSDHVNSAPHERAWSNRLKQAGPLAGLFVVYVLTAKLGLRLNPVAGFATLVWPPAGLALAALLLFGKRVWPAVAIGAFVVNFTAGASALVALGIGVGNTLEALVGAYFVADVLGIDRSLWRSRDVFAFVIATALVSTTVSATIGTLSLWAGGVTTRDAVPDVWRTRWIGDSLGDLIIAPLCLVWWRTPAFKTWRRFIPEALALGSLIVIVSFYIFDVVLLRGRPEQFRWPFLIFPALLWAATRFRQRGATAANFLVWIVFTFQTANGAGPFRGATLNESLTSLQLFMAVVSTTTLLLGAVLTERDRAALVRDVALATAAAAERRSRFLADAMATLTAGALEYDQTMQNIARLVIPDLADNCVVDMVMPDGTIRRVAEASVDPRKEELLHRLRKYPVVAGRPSPVNRVLASGKTEFTPRFDGAALESVAWGNEEYAAIVRAIAPTSSVTVPLRSRGRVIGAITFGMAESGRAYRPEDIQLAEELADRAALVVDNASLYSQSQQAVRARDVFLAVASHELRTPITALDLQLANLERLLQRSRPEALSYDNLQSRIRDLHRQVDRLTGLITRLLDVSRFVSGRLELEPEPFDMREVVLDAVTRFREQATAAGCELRLTDGIACVGAWDRLRTEQVLSNLLSNAVKFGAGQPIGISLNCTDTEVTLSVRDGGPGIPATEHERVFERFQQTEHNRTFGGLGLGLWISRQIITAMGGTIELKSEPGIGTEFTVTLPRDVPAA